MYCYYSKYYVTHIYSIHLFIKLPCKHIIYSIQNSCNISCKYGN